MGDISEINLLRAFYKMRSIVVNMVEKMVNCIVQRQISLGKIKQEEGLSH